MNRNTYDPIYYVDERNVDDSCSSGGISCSVGEEKPSEFSWTVSEFLKNADDHFKSLGTFYIYGEISEISTYNHIYFKLKDEKSTVDCVIWQSTCRSIGFAPKKGDKVEIICSLSLYVKNGQFKLVVNSMRKLGLGTIIEQLNLLKQKLSSEGVFDLNKRELPRFINTVGIVTSSDGRALGDIVKTIKSRNNLIDIILYPSLVQGNSAPATLVKALDLANEHNKCDVIIFGRGGGSFEDLLCFYDESVVRAVAHSRIPIISAVGHEADVAFTDFAADKRAATPTRAAEYVTPFTKQDLFSTADSCSARLDNSIGRYLDNYVIGFDNLYKRLKNVGPQSYIDKTSHLIELLNNRLQSALDNQISYLDRQISLVKQKLSNFEPNLLVNSKQLNVISLSSRLDNSIQSLLEKRTKDLNFDNRIAVLDRGVDKRISDLYLYLIELLNNRLQYALDNQISCLDRQISLVKQKLSNFEPNSLVNSKQLNVISLTSRLDNSIQSLLEKRTKELNFDNRIAVLDRRVDKRISDLYLNLNRLVNRNSNCHIEQSIQDKLHHLTKLSTKMTGLNPMYILCQRYSVTVNKDGSVIDSNSLTSGNVIKSILKDCTITSTVLDVKKEDNLNKTRFGEN